MPTQKSEDVCPTQTCMVFPGLYNLLTIQTVNDKERALRFFFSFFFPGKEKDSFEDMITNFEQNILNLSFDFELF